MSKFKGSRRGVGRDAMTKQQVYYLVQAGTPRKEIAASMGVSEASISRYTNQVREMILENKASSVLEPKERSQPMWRGRGKCLDDRAFVIVKQHFVSYPWTKLESIVKALHQHYGYACTDESVVSRFCKRRGFFIKDFKKLQRAHRLEKSHVEQIPISTQTKASTNIKHTSFCMTPEISNIKFNTNKEENDLQSFPVKKIRSNGKSEDADTLQSKDCDYKNINYEIEQRHNSCAKLSAYNPSFSWCLNFNAGCCNQNFGDLPLNDFDGSGSMYVSGPAHRGIHCDFSSMLPHLTLCNYGSECPHIEMGTRCPWDEYSLSLDMLTDV